MAITPRKDYFLLCCNIRCLQLYLLILSCRVLEYFRFNNFMHSETIEHKNHPVHSYTFLNNKVVPTKTMTHKPIYTQKGSEEQAVNRLTMAIWTMVVETIRDQTI